ncbi:hypothetical protein DLE60_12675 [Micromonospora globispora]|nr:hypothetical protein DLE60_12675 [Micromonospora globispora]
MQQFMSQLQHLLSAPGSGPVNWDLARQVAASQLAATGDPAVSPFERNAVEEALRIADLWLEPATSWPSGIRTSVAWNRNEWIYKTLDVWRKLCDPVASRMVGAMGDLVPPEARAQLGPMQSMVATLGGALFGGQLGQALGSLAAEVLSAGDIGLPLGPAGTAALIPANIRAYGEGLELPEDEVRLYVALREAAHQRLFQHVPWLRGHVLTAVENYASGIRVNREAIEEAMGRLDPTDPESMQAIALEGIFTPEDTPAQKASLARLETVLALVEGWVGHVVDTAAGDRLPNVVRLGEAFRRRRAAGVPSRERRTPAERWAGVVQRKPLAAAILAGAILLALAAPALSMRLSLPDASVQPHDRSSYTSYEILSEGFGPGYGAPLIFAAQVDSTNADLRPVVEAVRKTEGIAYATQPRISTDGQAAIFMAFPRTGYQEEATADLVHELRDDVLPKASGGEEIYVGGPNAGAIDFAEDTSSRLPLMITVVIALSLVLLIALVRSVTIALQAAVMNLLSIGAAYGVLVAIVQWGWFGPALGFPTDMPVTTWVPMMMFPLLFGLSMDYEVFLISRIREEYERTGDTRRAVTRGLARTAKVITAAAAIMIAIFTTALLGPDVSVKQIGLGMAVAVLVDATIIRMVLVPAVMELCGKANWWMPGRRARKATSAAQAAVGEGARA